MTFSWWPPEPSSTPRSNAARRIRGGAIRVGRRGRRDRPRSRSRRTGPRPRTSPTCGVIGQRGPELLEQPRPDGRGALRRGPRHAGHRWRPSPAARLTASPMNVEVCVPGAQWAMNAARPTTADSGQPAADPLADGHEVRHDAPVLGRPGPARPPEPALDLVEDEDGAVAVAQLAQAGEEAVGWDDDAAVALDRLDDDRRRPVRSRRPDPRAHAGRARGAISPAPSPGPSGQRYGYG